MNQFEAFVKDLNKFIHTWFYAYKNIELKYVQLDDGRFGENYYSDYMYIIWANGRQNRIYMNKSCEETILSDFVNDNYEDVPEDEYI